MKLFSLILISVVCCFVSSCYGAVCTTDSLVFDCADVKAAGNDKSGVYRIYVAHEGKYHCAAVYCDMTSADRTWTVFQRRKDGSKDFYLNWTDYENGFGDPHGEFWLGNKFLYLLTLKRSYRLRIDLEDFEGGKRYAEYSTFKISEPTDRYKLTVTNYNGTAGDSLKLENGHRFSTKDNDFDVDQGNCAVVRHGAWWYQKCGESNLNGWYLRGNYSSNGTLDGYEGVRWYTWYDRYYSLKMTQMKISSS